MKILWISLLFLIHSTPAERNEHSNSEIKNKTLGQVKTVSFSAKKISQNETNIPKKTVPTPKEQKTSLKSPTDVKTKTSKKEAPLLKETKSNTKKFQVSEDLQSEIKLLKEAPSQTESPAEKDSALPFNVNAFKKIVSGLKKEDFNSEKYKKKVHSLEASFYNRASFDSLELLADLFDKKTDSSNQIKVLEIIVSNYPENPKSHFLLGIGYKQLYLKNTEKDTAEIKKKAIESLSQSIKLKRNYHEAYEQLLPLLMTKEPLKAGHNHFSLSLIKDMIRYLHDPINYSILCEAYYETNFVKQTRKACLKAIEEDPKQPKNHLYLALVQESKKDIKKEMEKTAINFSDSYPVQLKAGLFFFKENPTLATKYFNKAAEIQPHSYQAHIRLAWLLFNSDQIEKSYEHFFQACIHSKGKSMKDFQKATAQLRHKNKISVITETSDIERKWKKGISECFNQLKEKRQKTESI